MKFIKLEILNLASLDRMGGEVINFEEGALGDSTIFSIVGPTGSGKSTILDAICLALYNRAPRYPRKKGDRNQNIEIFGELEDGEKNRLAPTDSRNILTRGRKEGYSKLTFLANNGNVYRAEWYIRKKTKNYDDATTSLYKLTATDGTPSEEATEWGELPRIIGLDYEQFLRTVLIAQGSFAGFLIAKENERYELLEKLIGCEELYTSIASKIKQKKDEAVKVYDQISANVKAQEKDIISEEELALFTQRIRQLEAEEKKAKEEISKVKGELDWYVSEEKFVCNIDGFEKKYNEAKNVLESIKEQVGRLSLHDATLTAVSYYKDMVAAKEKVMSCDKNLAELSTNIEQKTNLIKEEGTNLETLNLALQKAKDELEVQKPKINKAREIKVEIDTAKRAANEKKQAMNEANSSKEKADKGFADNAVAVTNAEKGLQDAIDELSKVEKDIKSHSKKLTEVLNKAVLDYSEEDKNLKGKEITALQKEKSNSEKKQTVVVDAIRIQRELNSKRKAIDENEQRLKELSNRNDEINKKLKTFDVKALEKEYDTLLKSYTLMSSENWAEHRNNLTEGQPCPLCGSTHHPYHDEEVVAPVVDEMKSLVDSKRENLDAQRKKKQALTEELSKNSGTIEIVKKTLDDTRESHSKLTKEWEEVGSAYPEWPKDVALLQNLKKEIDSKASLAAEALEQYNSLVKKVEQLRNAKEKAEKAEREYADKSLVKKQTAEKKVQDARTLLATEKGKTEYLKNQQKDKAVALTHATEAYNKAKEEVGAKTEALKAEIGDKNPDDYERDLNKAKDEAGGAVELKMKQIGVLREELKGLQGKEISLKDQKKDEEKKETDARAALADWLSTYNSDNDHQALTDKDIAMLYSAEDDWEAIRANQKRVIESYTKAETTLLNEKKVHADHQMKKPDQSREALTQRMAELSKLSNAELVDAQARMQRHNAAKQQMGTMFEQKRDAEVLKHEWEEITDAIGGDGKTLRKIAQCYTLRFLIEHANVEIRKFNSRYELQQVKNSLGIRVIDHDRADDIRDTTSLSGGETFIVSLGLALGLSALSSRNISFENLFIDEGFGTLDPDTLATVIDSLAMLQSSQGKKVGVISHTDTMSERITTQIRIVKNGHSGSSHIEIYP